MGGSDPKKPDGYCVSPSQLKTFATELYPNSACHRKWFYSYVKGLRPPSTPKQKFGTQLHTCHENWFKFGQQPPETQAGAVAKMAILAKDFLPKRHDDMWVEKPRGVLRMQVGEDLWWWGFIDLVDPHYAENAAGLYDYKTTTDKRWMMTEEQLRRDAQSVMYSVFIMSTLGVEEVRARWAYHIASCPKDWPEKGRRQPKGVVPLDTTFHATDPDFKEMVQTCINISVDIQTAHREWKTEEDAKQNLNACDAYGGCYFAKNGMCKRDDIGILTAHLAQYDKRNGGLTKTDSVGNMALPSNDTEKPMSTLFAKIKADLEGKTEPTPADVAVAAVDAIASEPASVVKSPPAPVTDPAPEPEGVALVNDDTPAEDDPMVNAGNTEQEEFFQGTQWTEADLLKAHINTLKKMAKERGIKTSQKKAGLVSALLAAESGRSPATSAPSPTFADMAAEKKSNGSDGFVVMFDCHFRKRPHGFNGLVNLAEYVEPVAQQIAKAEGVEHFGLMEFGKGAPMLAAKVDTLMRKSPPQGIILVDSYSLYGKALKDVLIRHAQTAVQALK